VLDVLVAEIVLQGSGIVPVVTPRQCFRPAALATCVPRNHRPLLRPRRERPRSRRTAEQRNEFTSPHIRSQAQETALYRLKRAL
jgi:hypothetical protein